MTTGERFDAQRRKLEGLRHAEQTARSQLRAIRAERLRCEGALELLAQLRAEERASPAANTNGSGAEAP